MWHYLDRPTFAPVRSCKAHLYRFAAQRSRPVKKWFSAHHIWRSFPRIQTIQHHMYHTALAAMTLTMIAVCIFIPTSHNRASAIVACVSRFTLVTQTSCLTDGPALPQCGHCSWPGLRGWLGPGPARPPAHPSLCIARDTDRQSDCLIIII